MSRISRGFRLFQETFGILKKDREMILFPILSGIVTLLVVATFLLPLAFSGILSESYAGGSFLLYVLLFLFYVVSYFIVIYFNTALVSCALIRLDGRDPTFMDGIHAASARIGKILSWTLIAATVGLILRLIRGDGDNLLASLASALLGAAWSLATFFVIPVIVVDDVGGLAAIQRSWKLFRSTWGETVVGSFSLGLIFIPAVLLLLVGLVAAMAGSFEVGVGIIGVALLLWVVSAVLYGALQGIFVAIMYRYATTGVVPDAIDRSLVEDAFVPKGSLR
ncbi:DUF6159 family protein [Methanogenium organophilum]|uniref:DUF6159 family protein n=1 Tax=Methanogenium organophilum TaxID=2199 RepID=A0A9X9S755_METOG|nr:DUF6159 family protein [Methanogenium organophilum]WAI02090.1 DUF6159 family protein [Methanogenium organophilum]